MSIDRVDKIIMQWNHEIPTLNTTSMAILGRLSIINKQIERSLQDNFTTYNVNCGEFDVLATLRRSGEPYRLKPTELFNFLMITSGAMTNRIDTLEKKGLVVRENDKVDRRAVYVKLTETGLNLINNAVFKHVEVEDRALAALDKNEKRLLSELLKKVMLNSEND